MFLSCLQYVWWVSNAPSWFFSLQVIEIVIVSFKSEAIVYYSLTFSLESCPANCLISILLQNYISVASYLFSSVKNFFSIHCPIGGLSLHNCRSRSFFHRGKCILIHLLLSGRYISLLTSIFGFMCPNFEERNEKPFWHHYQSVSKEVDSHSIHKKHIKKHIYMLRHV